MLIKEMPADSRPRERFRKYGVDALSDSELLALILGGGTHKQNVLDVANSLINKFGLSNLTTRSATEMQIVKGIGPVRSMKLKAVFELQARVSVPALKKIESAEDVYNHLAPRFAHADKEHIIVLLLNVHNKIIKEDIVSVGILDAALIHPREIFKNAIRENAHKVIVVHNHPSGDPSPSEEDIKAIKRLSEASSVIGIRVLDHVILGRDSFYSYEEMTN